MTKLNSGVLLNGDENSEGDGCLTQILSSVLLFKVGFTYKLIQVVFDVLETIYRF